MTDDVRTVFLQAAETALISVEDPRVGERWDQQSALVGYSVGGLASHLCRGISNPLGYLDAAEPSDGEFVDAARYFRIAVGDHDPVDSGAHLAVRQRSDDMAATGWMAVVDATRSALQQLKLRLALEEPTRAVTVFGGIPMRLDDYLQTRIVELVIHGDDLDVSCGGGGGGFADEAWAISRDVVSTVAALRTSDRDLVLSLSRRERTERPLAF